MTTVPMDSVAFSEFLQRPTSIAARLTKSRMLRLRRRDADDLVLMSADRAEREGEVIDLTARLLSAMAQADPKAMAEALPRVLAWMKFLPAQEALDFATEFLATARAASSIDNMSAVSHVITAWRHTAEIYSDPELYKALTSTSLGDHGEVERPEEV